MNQDVETLEALLARYSIPERLGEVPRMRFDDAVRTGEDPLKIIAYFGTLGIKVREPADLFRLNDDPNEEEINAFWIPQGVAVSVESDDLWLVFEIDQSKVDGTETDPSTSTTSPSANVEGDLRQ